jgi:signal transduction histidine kinase/transcriptional regulator with GAF, ATPase, and Fis domain
MLTRARRTLVQQLDRRIHRSIDLDYTFKVTVEELGEHLSLDRCVLWLLDSSKREARPAFQYCARGIGPLRESVLRVEFQDIAKTITSEGALVVPDSATDPAVERLYGSLGSRPPKSFVCLPVELEGLPRAVLTMASVSEAREWSEGEIELGRVIADRLALAIRQAELFKQLQESAREAEALYRASSLLVDTSDVDRLYEQILDAVADVFGHPNSNIWLIDDNAGAALLTYTRGDLPDNMKRCLSIEGPGLIPHAIRSARIVNVPDVLADARYVPGLADTRAELLVPLIVGHKVIAVFNLESPTPNAFTGRDERILSSFAERAARAVEQARLYTRAQESAARESLISRITRLLNRTINYELIFGELVEELGRSLALDRCFLTEADTTHNLIKVTHQFASSGGLLPGTIPLDELAEVYFPPRGRPNVQADVRSAAASTLVADHFASAEIRGFLSVPASGTDFGKLALVCATSATRQWKSEDVDLIEVLAAQVGATRERAELFKEVIASQRECEKAAQRAAQAEKLRALGQLAGGVVHNFNNLLAAILGHAQLLKRHLAAGPLTDHVETIERAATDGAAMVRRINNFSISESEEALDRVNLNQLIRDSLELTRIRWQEDARARGINYTMDFQAGPARSLAGNGGELREVFVNIILNALDAMEVTGGRLLIETGESADEVFARFTDQGIGMSPEVQARIFDPFFTTKGPAGGGLGLSGSNVAVRRHGGRIAVESVLGRGSRFVVWLPVLKL